MISTRLAGPVAVLLGLALLPTVIHSYVGLDNRDGRSVAALEPSLEHARSTPTQRKAAWVARIFQSDDWTERQYRAGNSELVMFAARSYDAKSLYHHPELALARGVDLESHGTVRLSALPDVPVHALVSQRRSRTIVLYALEYDGRYIENPIMFQLWTSVAQLFSGRKALTLIFVLDRNSPSGLAVHETPAARLLTEAIRSFNAQRPDPAN